MKDKKKPDLQKATDIDVRKYFDVARYGGVADLGAGGWANQIFTRKVFWPFLLDKQGLRDSPIDGAKLLIQLLADPLGRLPREDPVLHKVNFGGVNDLKVYEVWSEHQAMGRNDQIRIACLEYDELLKSDEFRYGDGPTLCRESYHAASLSGSSSRQECWVNIDLTNSDEQLVVDFQEWLCKKRTLLEGLAKPSVPADNFGQQNFAEWAEKQALGYIDLEIFSSSLGCRLTDRLIGELLFPDEGSVDTTERVRKVVRPCARMLMRDQTFEVLDAQAAAELRASGVKDCKVLDLPEFMRCAEEIQRMKEEDNALKLPESNE